MDDHAEARRRKAHVLAKEIGLTREERIEVASYLLRRDLTSWKQLEDADYSRILDALEGYQLVEVLISLRGAQVEC